MTEQENYFNSDYVRSRHKYVADLRKLLADGLPTPEKDWDSVYVFSGPELTFEEPPHENGPYNQTKFRLETGFDLAKQMTALRLGKPYDEVTVQDIRSSGPAVYFDGYSGHNEYMKAVIAKRRLETEFGFPDDKFIVPERVGFTGTAHTGEQIEHFPDAILESGKKFAVVSDLYHIPRLKAYLGGVYDKKRISKDNAIFYFAGPPKVPFLAARREARNRRPYFRKGFLSSD